MFSFYIVYFGAIFKLLFEGSKTMNQIEAVKENSLREWIQIEQSFQSTLNKEVLNVIRPLDIKYVYNREIVDFICNNLLVDLIPQEIENLKVVVYIARGLLRNERRLKTREKTIAEGWILLREDVIKKAFENKQRLQVKGRENIDWFTVDIEGIFKPFIDCTGACFIMKPKAKKRGRIINDNMLDAEKVDLFCKII